MVNIAGARLVLNLKAYAAARSGDPDLDWEEPNIAKPIPTSLCTPASMSLRTPLDDLPPTLIAVRSGLGSCVDSLEFEMRRIEREGKQLGTRLR